MNNIYELTGDYKKIMALIEEGELDSEMLQDTLEAIEGNLEVKAENYGFIAKNLESQALMLDTEIKRLQERSSYCKKQSESMQQTVFDMMKATNNTGFKTDHFTFKTRKSSALAVDEYAIIPKEYLKVKTIQSVDKTALKKAIQSGAIIKGVTIENRTNYAMK